jgi:sugar lactone lactonase YvrE
MLVVTGFSGPESVRYDPEQDVWFVSNFNGPGGAADDNGFISRVRPDGTIDRLRFVAGGTNGVTLHAPRGMAIVGDTLWAADVGAVRGFDRRTGAPLATIDFSGLDAGFLNDVTPGPDGALYVTDTQRQRVYRIAGGAATVALADTALGRPNGITWDRVRGRLLVLPFGGRQAVLAWRPGGPALEALATGTGGRYDGVEVLASGALLLSSQADSTLVLLDPAGGRGRAWVRTAGAPADIGVDTRRGRVAVPYIALDRVDVWALPER